MPDWKTGVAADVVDVDVVSRAFLSLGLCVCVFLCLLLCLVVVCPLVPYHHASLGGVELCFFMDSVMVHVPAAYTMVGLIAASKTLSLSFRVECARELLAVA